MKATRRNFLRAAVVAGGAVGCGPSMLLGDGGGRDAGGRDGLDAGGDPGIDGGPVPRPPWQLEAGHFIPAKMAPEIIHPRPDAETESNAACRLWPSETAWRLPIGVQGGAWPFLYELVDNGGLAGLTITETLPPDWLTDGLQNYGVLTCASPAAGTYAIRVRVTDQDSTVVERTFTLNVVSRESTADFVWVDAANGNDATGTGTYSSPKQTHTGWYGTTEEDATNAGKQVHFRAGTYNITDVLLQGSAGQLVIITAEKPQVFSAVEGETVIFDGENTAYFFFDDEVPGDVALIGIEFRNCHTAEGGGRSQHVRLQGIGAETRFLSFRCKYDGTGAAGGSNSSCIFFGEASPAIYGQYGLVSQNDFSNVTNMDHVLFYTVQYTLMEGNESTGMCAGGQGFFYKGEEMDHNTVRANRHLNHHAPLIFMSEFTGNIKTHLEVCWNSAHVPVARDDGYGAIALGQGPSTNTNTYGPFWSYRNNWQTNHILCTALEGGPFRFENECIQCSPKAVADNGIAEEDGAQAVMEIVEIAVASSGMFDANNLLTGSARTTYLGTHGCEVA